MPETTAIPTLNASLLENEAQLLLFQKLESFELDKDVELPFSYRLAKENGWTWSFAKQAIAEYKKFLFMAIVSDCPVTPSEQIDQVWHLHLSYTRSYWDELCGEVLGRPLHHEPTQGGMEERDKYQNLYAATLSLYAELFDDQPPEDFWPSPESRFGPESYFQRVNRTQNYVLPKLQLQTLIATGVLTLLVTLVSVYLLFQNINGTTPPLLLGVGLSVSASVYGAIRLMTEFTRIRKNPGPLIPGYAIGGCMGCGGCGGCGG